ncbi:MAG: XTP/dITP diphosphatase [Thermoplasmata archaeon]
MGFATSNEGKFKEISQKMAERGYELEHVRLSYPEIQADTLEETIVPALEWLVQRHSGPLMIDDSGLFVDALRGFPGVYSSYVFRTIGCKGILRLMEGVSDRGARFECCIGFIAPGQQPSIVKGIARGAISHDMRGTGGFGYDPIFVPEGYSQTYAEMDIHEKNRISHRARAVEAFLERLPMLLP